MRCGHSSVSPAANAVCALTLTPPLSPSFTRLWWNRHFACRLGSKPLPRSTATAVRTQSEMDEYPACPPSNAQTHRWYAAVKELWYELEGRLRDEDRQRWFDMVGKLPCSKTTATPFNHSIGRNARMTGNWFSWLFLRAMFGHERIRSCKTAAAVAQANPGTDLEFDVLPKGYFAEFMDSSNMSVFATLDAHPEADGCLDRESSWTCDEDVTSDAEGTLADADGAIRCKRTAEHGTGRGRVAIKKARIHGQERMYDELRSIKAKIAKMESVHRQLDKRMEELLAQQTRLWDLMRTQFDAYLDEIKSR
ncbi:hypothetical protein RJ55_07465 [Drechmeria coniospora]|nr:hypothetical protein RJ55_07465 [Drechmeria coniospora]